MAALRALGAIQIYSVGLNHAAQATSSITGGLFLHGHGGAGGNGGVVIYLYFMPCRKHYSEISGIKKATQSHQKEYWVLAMVWWLIGRAKELEGRWYILTRFAFVWS